MRFIMAVAIIIVSFALFALDITMPHVQAASASSCVSAIPSPVQGTPLPASLAPGTLFINEILTNPHTGWNCADQLSPPKNPLEDEWIELYNPQSQTIELTSWHFNMNDTQGNNQTFNPPSESVIAAHSFLVLFPSMELTNTYSIQLIVGSAIIDSVSIPTLLPDQSYARIPDGSPNWQVSNYSTVGTNNRLDPPTPTPTPTKIPTPTKTPKIRVTRTKTPKATRSSSSNQNTTTVSPTSNSTNTSSTNDGTQPSWHTLQFPGGTTTPSPVLATVTPSSTTPQQSADTSDLPKKVIISVSVVVLAFALLWCWKHFLSP